MYEPYASFLTKPLKQAPRALGSLGASIHRASERSSSRKPKAIDCIKRGPSLTASALLPWACMRVLILPPLLLILHYHWTGRRVGPTIWLWPFSSLTSCVKCAAYQITMSWLKVLSPLTKRPISAGAFGCGSSA